MKSLLTLSTLGLLLASGAAFANTDVDELYQAKNCNACHRIERVERGPSFKQVAVKYANEKGADAKLALKIRAGGAGVWGPDPMPAQPHVTEAEALTLSRWILKLN